MLWFGALWNQWAEKETGGDATFKQNNKKKSWPQKWSPKRPHLFYGEEFASWSYRGARPRCGLERCHPCWTAVSRWHPDGRAAWIFVCHMGFWYVLNLLYGWTSKTSETACSTFPDWPPIQWSAHRGRPWDMVFLLPVTRHHSQAHSQEVGSNLL